MIATLPPLTIEPLALARAVPAHGDQFAALLAAMAETPVGTDGTAAAETPEVVADGTADPESPAPPADARPALSPEILALLALLAPAAAPRTAPEVRATATDGSTAPRRMLTAQLTATSPQAVAAADPALERTAAALTAALSDGAVAPAADAELPAMAAPATAPAAVVVLDSNAPANEPSNAMRSTAALVDKTVKTIARQPVAPTRDGARQEAATPSGTDRAPAEPDVAQAAETLSPADPAGPQATLADAAAASVPHAAHGPAEPVRSPAPAPPAATQPAPDPGHHQLAAARDAAWLDGLARDIASAAAPDGTARFAVAPERLGEVRVEIARGDEGASVRLATADERAHALLADAAPTLQAEARASGVRIAETQIDLSGGRSGQGGDQRAPAPAPILRTAAAAAPTSPAPVKRHQAQDRYA
ncbi:flagellar hook-length control protein FliK [Sphingomonas jatrophae]|uniref:Hook-length control protein FliK n=1 Tax=Sphingomonas jatrophae TaxID=1166337 RepID=A0A1I6MBE0_9SPHN|nr:flagellar hook-length control protein FliK [Sphingomonas jatrophae]SFS12927.1 hook-length control protein FliK [Sphingomonas jatrophae]